MSQESSVEVPYNKSVLGAWISRCLEVRAVREVLGNVAFPSARVSSANVNKAGPTFCGDVRGADLAAEIVGHSYRVIDLNADFKKAVSQRNQEKAAKEKAAAAETPKKEVPKEAASPVPTTFSLGEPIKADLPKEDKIAKVRLMISMCMRAACSSIDTMLLLNGFASLINGPCPFLFLPCHDNEDGGSAKGSWD